MSGTIHELVFDVSQVRLVESPGFVPPRLRARYTDTEVQSILSEAFDGMLPTLTLNESDDAVYRWIREGREICATSEELTHLDEIPQGEVMRLLRGFIKLHQMLVTDDMPEGARSLLMNLRIPHPEKAIALYRKWHVSEDEERMFIVHGFEGEEWPMMPIEEVLALLMNTSTLHVEEFAASVEATQRVRLSTQQVQLAAIPETGNPRHWKWLATAAAVAAMTSAAFLLRAPVATASQVGMTTSPATPASNATLMVGAPPAPDVKPATARSIPPSVTAMIGE